MKNQILLPTSIKRELRQTFKATRNELDRALKYKLNSDRAKTLRAAAIERGAVLYNGTPPNLGQRRKYDFVEQIEKNIVLYYKNSAKTELSKDLLEVLWCLKCERHSFTIDCYKTNSSIEDAIYNELETHIKKREGCLVVFNLAR